MRCTCDVVGITVAWNNAVRMRELVEVIICNQYTSYLNSGMHCDLDLSPFYGASSFL